MGMPMAQRFISRLPSTFSLSVYDVRQEAIQSIVSFREGHETASCKVIPCESPREVSNNSELIITIVPEDSHVKKVFEDPKDGILSSGNLNGKIYLDCSTVHPLTSSHIRKELAEREPQAIFWDAPVSGGTKGSANGTLTFMLGVKEDDPNLPRVKDVVKHVGKNIFVCGGPTLGLVIKMSNNYLNGMITLLTSEAMNVGIKWGMDPKLMSEIISKSSGANYVNENYNPVPGVHPDAVTSRDYALGFRIELMHKDLSLARSMAESVDAKMLLADTGIKAYEQLGSLPDYNGKDCKIVYQWIKNGCPGDA